jgi:hypothetical protein
MQTYHKDNCSLSICIQKGYDGCVLVKQSELLASWSLSIVRNSKNTEEQNVSGTDSVSILRAGEEDTIGSSICD